MHCKRRPLAVTPPRLARSVELTYMKTVAHPVELSMFDRRNLLKRAGLLALMCELFVL